jgi:cytidine deaminase
MLAQKLSSQGLEHLLWSARQLVKPAYALFRFKVGAALLTSEGKILWGANEWREMAIAELFSEGFRLQ